MVEDPTPNNLFPVLIKSLKFRGGGLTVAVAVAPFPLPIIVTVGAPEYPDPPSTTVTPVTAPPATVVIRVGSVPPQSGPVITAVALVYPVPAVVTVIALTLPPCLVVIPVPPVEAPSKK